MGKIMANKAPDLQMRPDDILYVPASFGKHWARLGLKQ